MTEASSRTVAVTLRVVHLRGAEGDPSEVACPGCGHELDLHQPDPHSPTRLLGTCDACPSWAMIEVGLDESLTLVAVPRLSPLVEGLVLGFE